MSSKQKNSYRFIAIIAIWVAVGFIPLAPAQAFTIFNTADPQTPRLTIIKPDGEKIEGLLAASSYSTAGPAIFTNPNGSGTAPSVYTGGKASPLNDPQVGAPNEYKSTAITESGVSKILLPVVLNSLPESTKIKVLVSATGATSSFTKSELFAFFNANPALIPYPIANLSLVLKIDPQDYLLPVVGPSGIQLIGTPSTQTTTNGFAYLSGVLVNQGFPSIDIAPPTPSATINLPSPLNVPVVKASIVRSGHLNSGSENHIIVVTPYFSYINNTNGQNYKIRVTAYTATGKTLNGFPIEIDSPPDNLGGAPGLGLQDTKIIVANIDADVNEEIILLHNRKSVTVIKNNGAHTTYDIPLTGVALTSVSILTFVQNATFPAGSFNTSPANQECLEIMAVESPTPNKKDLVIGCVNYMGTYYTVPPNPPTTWGTAFTPGVAYQLTRLDVSTNASGNPTIGTSSGFPVVVPFNQTGPFSSFRGKCRLAYAPGATPADGEIACLEKFKLLANVANPTLGTGAHLRTFKPEANPAGFVGVANPLPMPAGFPAVANNYIGDQEITTALTANGSIEKFAIFLAQSTAPTNIQSGFAGFTSTGSVGASDTFSGYAYNSNIDGLKLGKFQNSPARQIGYMGNTLFKTLNENTLQPIQSYNIEPGVGGGSISAIRKLITLDYNKSGYEGLVVLRSQYGGAAQQSEIKFIRANQTGNQTVVETVIPLALPPYPISGAIWPESPTDFALEATNLDGNPSTDSSLNILAINRNQLYRVDVISDPTNQNQHLGSWVGENGNRFGWKMSDTNNINR